jgi:hypothetical protein
MFECLHKRVKPKIFVEHRVYVLCLKSRDHILLHFLATNREAGKPYVAKDQWDHINLGSRRPQDADQGDMSASGHGIYRVIKGRNVQRLDRSGKIQKGV